MLLNSNTFLCFTELVWRTGSYGILRNEMPCRLNLLDGSVAPGEIDGARKHSNSKTIAYSEVHKYLDSGTVCYIGSVLQLIALGLKGNNEHEVRVSPLI